jgi:hypothetical protein
MQRAHDALSRPRRPYRLRIWDFVYRVHAQGAGANAISARPTPGTSTGLAQATKSSLRNSTSAINDTTPVPM